MPTAVSACSVAHLGSHTFLLAVNIVKFLYRAYSVILGPLVVGRRLSPLLLGHGQPGPPSCLSADWAKLPAGLSSPGGLAAQMHEASSSHRGSACSCSSPMSSTLLIPLSPPTTSRQRPHSSRPHAPAEDVLASAVWTRQGSSLLCSRPQPQAPAAAREVERPHFSGDAAADLHNSRNAAAAGMEGVPRSQLAKVAAAGQGAAASTWDSPVAQSSGLSDCQGSSGDACSDSGSSSCYNSADSQSMQPHLSPPPAQRERRAAGSAVSSRDEVTCEVTSDEASSLQQTVAEPELVGPRRALALEGSLEGRSEGSPGLQELELQSAGQELAAQKVREPLQCWRVLLLWPVRQRQRQQAAGGKARRQCPCSSLWCSF